MGIWPRSASRELNSVGLEALTVTTERIGGVNVVHVRGEVDLGTAPPLERALSDMCATTRPPDSIVVDLTEVTFCASAGLALLAATHQRCHSRQVPLRLVVTNPAILRPLRVTGLDKVLELHGSIANATRAESA